MVWKQTIIYKNIIELRFEFLIKTSPEALIYDIVKIYLVGISKTSHQYKKITKNTEMAEKTCKHCLPNDINKLEAIY